VNFPTIYNKIRVSLEQAAFFMHQELALEFLVSIMGDIPL
jgi:hypothetical protein